MATRRVSALSWSWYLLGQHADVQEQLRDEAAGRLQGRTPTIEDLPHLPLATAVFEESMRLFPPAWGVPREAIDVDDLQDRPVPKGAIFTVAQFLTHRHPDFWTEPDRFDPTRFLPGQSKPRHKGAYFPFGGGPRICIGNHLAMMEGSLVLAALAQRFQVTLVPGQDVVTVFRGVAMTGDIELGTLASVNEEVSPALKKRSMRWLHDFSRRTGYHIHSVFSAHLNDVRLFVNWPDLFVV